MFWYIFLFLLGKKFNCEQNPNYAFTQSTNVQSHKHIFDLFIYISLGCCYLDYVTSIWAIWNVKNKLDVNVWQKNSKESIQIEHSYRISLKITQKLWVCTLILKTEWTRPLRIDFWLFGTRNSTKQTKDCHCPLCKESPMNITLFPLILSSASLASNLIK